MKKFLKTVAALLLTTVMIVSLFPTLAFADGDETPAATEPVISVEETTPDNNSASTEGTTAEGNSATDETSAQETEPAAPAAETTAPEITTEQPTVNEPAPAEETPAEQPTVSEPVPVEEPVVILENTITSQPVDAVVVPGKKATFAVEAYGKVSSYKWQYSTNGGRTWKDYGSKKASITVTTSKKGTNNGYKYRCIVTFKNKTKVTSDVATLYVSKGFKPAVNSESEHVDFVDVKKVDPGTFPEGTSAEVTDVDPADYVAVIDEALTDIDVTADNITAVDISFKYDDKEFEPANGKEVEVILESTAIKEGMRLVHIDDYGNVEEVPFEFLEDGKISFKTGTFSIYLIIDGDDSTQSVVQARVTYHFLDELKSDGTADPFYFVNKAGDTVDYQIVKNDELLDDPGTPVTGLEKNFLGWFVVTRNNDGTYSFPVGGSRIDFTQIPPVTTTTSEGDKEVYVAPRFGQAFIVTFWDNKKGSPEDEMHIVAKKVVYLDEGATYATVQVNNVTVPTAATQTLSGWKSDDYKEDQITTYSLLEKPYWDEVTQSFNLYPEFSDGHWLRFSGGPSGSGAGYRPAIFVTANTQASEIASLGKVGREGYTFAGWFDGPGDDAAQITDEFGNVSDVDALLARVQAAETTLHAHWTGNQVTYRVATWFENADDEEYSYGSLAEYTGEAGTETNVVAEEVEGFTAKTVEQQVINGDGTTIVNVYYDRNEYEIKFYSCEYDYVEATDDSEPLYVRVNGEYYQASRSGNNWYYYVKVTNVQPNNNYYIYWGGDYGWVEVNYYGNQGSWFNPNYIWRVRINGQWQYINQNTMNQYAYSRNNANNLTRYQYRAVSTTEIPELTITAKYGATVASLWPSRRTDLSRTYPVNWRIDPDGNVYQSNQPQMPLGGASFYLVEESTGYIMNTYYYVQGLNGGNNFELDHLDAFNSDNPLWTTTVEDYYDILGFTVNFANASDATDTQGHTHTNYVINPNVETSTPAGSQYEQVTDTVYQVKMYYLRNQYEISFNTLKPGAATPSSLTGIYYKANIASTKATEIAALNQQYVVGETSVEVQGEGTYIFQGWYDNPDGMGDPFNFNQTMPAGNITLYAKWDRIWYRIEIEPRGGEILPAVSEVTYTWVRYNEKIEQYNIRRDYVETDSSYDGTKYYYYELLSKDDPDLDGDGYYSGYRKGFYISQEQLATKEAFLEAFPVYDTAYADANYQMILDHTDTSVVYKKATTEDNYAFVGWYDASTDKIYDFETPVTKPVTTIYAKWRRSGLFSVQYHTENGIVRGQINGSLVATDASYADQATTEIAYTPTHITSEDGETYVFEGWKVADPADFDQTDPGSATLVGDLMKQGADFTVDAGYADSSHYIHLVAVYELAEKDPNTIPVTTISFNPNFPTGAHGTTGQETVTIQGIPLNTAIDLGQDSFTIVLPDTADREETIPKFSTTEYVQTGWNTKPDGSGTAFKMTDTVGVDKLDKPNNTHVNTLYAIWAAKTFYVYHSSDGSVDEVPFTSLTDDGKYDITSKVKEGYLYGGYYNDYVKKGSYKGDGVAVTDGVNYIGGLGYWKKANAFTGTPLESGEGGIGTAMTPVAGHTYFLKEVPAGFLASKMYVLYDAHDNNTVKQNYLLSVVDDNNYSEVGLYAKNITTGDRIKLAVTYTINDTFNGKTDKINASSFNMKAGYVAVWRPSLATENFEFAASYTTPDGVTVEGAYIRMVRVGDGKYYNTFAWDDPDNLGFAITSKANDRITDYGLLNID